MATFEIVDGAGAEAPWLVMVHGMSQDRRAFSAQVDAFAPRYRLLLLDLPGHGLARDVPGPFGHVELAAHIHQAMATAGAQSCHFWGTHTGAAVGLLLAVEEPVRIRSLVLEGAVIPGRTMPSVEAEFQRARATARNQGVATARRQWFDEAGFFQVMRQRPEECRAQAHREMIAEFGGAPWLDDGAAAPIPPVEPRLAVSKLPVLLYNGAHDLPDFLATATRLTELLPHATHAMIPDAGGFPAWEFPNEVNRLVTQFLTSVDEQARARTGDM